MGERESYLGSRSGLTALEWTQYLSVEIFLMIAKVLVAGQLMSRSPSLCRAGASAKDRHKYPVVHTRLPLLQFDTPNKVQQQLRRYVLFYG